MRGHDAGAISTRLWFRALMGISAALIVVTFASYAVVDHRWLARVLFWFGLGGENNIGAWWSGMLLALAAFLALDGFFDRSKQLVEQRGWLALGCALLLLSFDEIASLHEYLAALGQRYLAVLGVVGLTLASYGMQQLHRARVPARTLFRLLIAFGLLATVPIHETIQQKLQWDNQVVYGLRAFLEEGTEIVAMLIFVAVTRETSASALRSSQDCLVALVRRPRLTRLTALLLWPILVAATFELPQPGGPADWLASTLFMACALLAVREGLLRGGFDSRSLALILFYAAVSAAANAMKIAWDPIVLGTSVNVRGIAFALLVVTGVAALKANGRRLRARHAFPVATLIGASAIVWPSSQLVWCAVPPVLAIWLYALESKAAAQGSRAPTGAAFAREPARPTKAAA
jgi:hypothetical protein